MKRLFFLIPLLALVLAGCSSDAPATPGYEELELNVVSIQNPEYAVTNFSSPDPGCGVPKMLSVIATTDANEVVVECPNFEIHRVTYSLYTTQKLRPEDIGVSTAIVDAHSFRINISECTVNTGVDALNTVHFTVIGRRADGNGEYTDSRTEMSITRVAELPYWVK